jgi:phosphoribosylanthranilate isomerase
MYRPRVKVCCIRSIEEVQLAVRYGASALGLVSEMPSGPGVIDEDQIAYIVRHIPPGVASFLLTSKQDTQQIIDQQRRLRTNTIQICDRITEGSYNDLRDALPGIGLVQVIHVTGEESIDEARSSAEFVDAILLDSGNQNLAVKVLGGTGRTHDWSISVKICRGISKPVYLAGGLHEENIAEAVRTVRPFGLDLCSGIRTNGILDKNKVRNFFRNIPFED